MKYKRVVVCVKCEKKLDAVTKLIATFTIPYEWYIQKDFIKKWDIYYCEECNLVYRTSKRTRYYYNKIKTFITGLIYEKEMNQNE